MYDCIITGGGISGISFAHFLHRAGKKVLVLEKENRTGGQIHTETFPDTDFWYETGAHTCYNSYVSLLSIIDTLGLTGEISQLDRKCPFRLYSQGKLKNIASALYIPSMLIHGPKAFFANKKGKTVREYYRYILGKRNYNRLFSKAFRAVISQPADDYPAEMLLKRRKSHCEEQPRKFSFSGGLSGIISAIVTKDGFPVETSVEVTGISKIGDVYEVTASSGRKWQATSVALAIDPPSVAALLRDLEPELANLLTDIPVFRSESLSVVIPKTALTVERMAGVIPLSDEFFSAVSRDLIEHPQWRCFTFHFAQGAKTDNEKLEIACRTLNIQPTDIARHSVTTHILPSPRIRHLNMAEQVAEKRKNDNIYLLGNYYKGLSLEDCVQRSQESYAMYRQ
jgi:protoporphyrinogen oxidase